MVRAIQPSQNVSIPYSSAGCIGESAHRSEQHDMWDGVFVTYTMVKSRFDSANIYLMTLLVSFQ